MKKIALVICVLLLVIGCGKKKTPERIVEDENFVLEKVKQDKDYVYYGVIDSFVLPDGTKYDIKNIIINLNSSDANNINMELRTFINRSFGNYVYEGNKLKSGTIIDYVFYKTDDYLSLVVNSKYLINNEYNDEKSKVYVLSMDKGKIVNNENLLKKYSLNEDKLYKKVEEKIETEDNLYTMKSFKDNGYYLYVNNDNKLVVLFYEKTDDENIKKELILD